MAFIGEFDSSLVFWTIGSILSKGFIWFMSCSQSRNVKSVLSVVEE